MMHSMLGKVTCLNYDNTAVHIKFDDQDHMYWKMVTDTTISFGREKISCQNLDDALLSISWKDNLDIPVNLVLNFETNNLIAIWTTDNVIHAVEGSFN
ncbi:hypothetical protein K5I29_04965 [Flavobacterium agricola]|uniref:MoaF-like domain-containing protein n=1 Tax=Flavobacterium agricola TaxID=2870839 RepID=A0ABY6M113_9FLAO|nr:hypothetical protein [Flavobacterium agricola]UYW02254.1 hypothetical protein K5I29_04965 [Flavobacterium agricola]